MKTPSTFLLALLAACIAGAQDVPAPAPAQSEMQKWFATIDEQWQAARKRDVTDVHAAELDKLKVHYLTALEAAIAKATSANDLNGAVALQKEQKRFGDTNVFLEQDDPADAASVKQVRAAIRPHLAKLETATAIRTKALHAKYDQMLAQAQTQLTQGRRLDDALLVKAKRDEVAAAWITPAVVARLQPEPPRVTPQPGLPSNVAATNPAALAKGATKAGDTLKALVGTWRFTWHQTGWNVTRTFKADGTLTTEEIPGPGKWKFVGDRIILTFANGNKNEMLLPLDPKGTKVMAVMNREMTAVKEK